MEFIEEKIDIREYLRVIMKRRWIIIAISSLIFVAVVIHAFTATPIFEASTRIIIDKENPNVVSIQEVMAVDASGTDYYQTQYKIIESRSVARSVIRRLALDKSEEFFPKPDDNFISVMIGSIKDGISSAAGAVASLFVTDKEKDEAKEIEESDNSLVSSFLSRLKIEPIRNSRLVDIKYQAKDPGIAAKIVNTISDAYIDQNLETKLAAIQNAVKWLHSRIEEERKKVETAEQALLRYKEQHGIITDFSSDTENITAQKLAQLNQQVVEAESLRVEAETRYKQAKALEGNPDMLDSIPQVLNNELIRQIKTMEVELFKKMSEFSKKYGSNHPQMVAIQSELKTLQTRKAQEINRVINSLNNEYKVALAKENSLKDSLYGQKKESLSLNQKAIEYTVLQREAQSAKEMYDLLIKRFKETSLTEDMKTGNVRIVDKAEVPKNPVKPRKGLNMIIGLIVGLGAGFGAAFFLEYLDNTIKIPEDIKRHLDIPYLGIIPLYSTNGNVAQQEGESALAPEMVTFHSPKSISSEAYRGIRTNILFSSADTEPQVLLISSAGPQEGKTITSTNIAIAMAQSGNKVVLIDCDLRRPKVHKLFGIKKDEGMTNLLVGNRKINDVIFETKIPNLYVIPSGPIPPNPSEILGSKRMKDLLDKLRLDFNKIIIDSPPIAAVTDSSILAKSADGVVLVVRAGETAREMVKTGVEQLKGIGAHVLGAVLNGVDTANDTYYYYQYYYYYYGEDGEAKKGERTRKKSDILSRFSINRNGRS